MQIRRKMVLIVVASILLTAVPGSALIFQYAQHSFRDNAAAQMEKWTAGLASSAMERFGQGEPKLSALARLLETELAQPIRPGELAAFHATMERGADGVWRNRKPGYDGRSEAGMFLPPDAGESDAQKVRHLRIKRIMDTFGAAASSPLENVWYLSPQRSEVIFDRGLAQFVFEMRADTDYTKTPWLTYTSPRVDPQREFRFTPPLFDPVSKTWMVSGLYPLYVDGKWIGSLGEDMPLTGSMQPLLGKTQLYAGVQPFLIDQQGNFALAGPWQARLEATPETFRPDLSHEPQLKALFELPLTGTPRLLSEQVSLQGKNYLAVGMKLEPYGWKYFRLVPLDAVVAPAREMFVQMAAMILAVAVMAGLMIGTAVGSTITKRIRLLRDVMKGYPGDHHLRAPVGQGDDDEIAEAARMYNRMADDMDQNIAERRMAEDDLKKVEELWRFALEGSGDGVWDWNVADRTMMVTRRWKEILGFAEDEIEDAFEEWVARVHPEDWPGTDVALRDCMEARTPIYSMEIRIRAKDGSYIWILDRGMVVTRDSEGKAMRMIGTQHDITARKQSQQALQSSLREKEALLKEVHHRVKNNLQVIASLLRLEAARNEHPITKTVLREMQGRIHSMAFLHESLYRSGTFASIELGGYLTQLTNQLLRALALPSQSIQLSLKMATVEVEMDQALPLGLLVTELVSNSLKHGFPNDRIGEVRVELGPSGKANHWRLCISDTGIGMPVDFESRIGGTLGLQLATDLAAQVGGSLDIEPGPPTMITLTFIPSEPNPSAMLA